LKLMMGGAASLVRLVLNLVGSSKKLADASKDLGGVNGLVGIASGVRSAMILTATLSMKPEM
jgi:hypothetical protein